VDHPLIADYGIGEQHHYANRAQRGRNCGKMASDDPKWFRCQ